MGTHDQHLNAGRIVNLALEQFETPMLRLIRQHLVRDYLGTVRHYRLRDDQVTFCNMNVITMGAVDASGGMNRCCTQCEKVEKRIRQARSAEGRRRHAARRQEAQKPPCALRVQIEQYLDTLDGSRSELSPAEEELSAFYKHVKGEYL